MIVAPEVELFHAHRLRKAAEHNAIVKESLVRRFSGLDWLGTRWPVDPRAPKAGE